MDVLALGAFVVSATALLGSPGPGIAALVAVGRAQGFVPGLRYYAGLQVGLALAAGITAAGLAWVLDAFPAALMALALVATAYLLYLAYRIATSPVGTALDSRAASPSPLAGLALGIANPKAFVAFASLFASHAIVSNSAKADLALKWTLCVVVMVVVDLAWLLVGVALNRANLRPMTERVLNHGLAAALVVAAASAFF